MTDRELADRYEGTQRLEASARAVIETPGEDRHEQEAAQAVLRQAVALRRALERWIVQRAIVAQQ